VKSFMNDYDTNIRLQGIRASETLYKYGETTLTSQYTALINDPDPRIAIQAIQTMYVLGIENIKPLINQLLKTNKARGVQVVGHQILKNKEEAENLKSTRYTTEELALYNDGKKIFDTFCSTCHGNKGLGTPTGPE